MYTAPYGIFARSCVAMAKDSKSTFQIIDDEGCPVDPTIFPGFSPEGNALQSIYEAFRFTESYGVIFQCNVKYCLGPCEPVTYFYSNIYIFWMKNILMILLFYYRPYANGVEIPLSLGDDAKGQCPMRQAIMIHLKTAKIWLRSVRKYWCWTSAMKNNRNSWRAMSHSTQTLTKVFNNWFIFTLSW